MKKFMFSRPGVACVTGAWKNMGTRKNGARVGDILLPSACIRGVPLASHSYVHMTSKAPPTQGNIVVGSLRQVRKL